MPATREELVKIAREVVTGTNRPTYCKNPAAFDPHEWVLEAMQRVYELGVERGGREALDGAARAERAAYDRGHADGHEDACQSRAGC